MKFIKNTFVGGTLLCFLIASAALAFGQDSTPPQQPTAPNAQRQNARRPMLRMLAMRRARMGRAIRAGIDRAVIQGGQNQPSITDEQRNQIRAIRDRYRQTFRTQGDEARKLRKPGQQGPLDDATRAQIQKFRQENMETRRKMREEILNTFTDEQRAQMEQRRNEMRTRMQERMQNMRDRFGMRGGPMAPRPPRQPDQPKPPQSPTLN